MSSAISDAKVDTSLDQDFGPHSVSQILGKKKMQHWKKNYTVNPADVPATTSLHDKPWFRPEDVDEAYDNHSGS